MTERKILIIRSVVFMALIALIIYSVMHDSSNPKPFTIEKSTDSEWEMSDTNYPDTTIVDTVIINEGKDTLYRTKSYLRVNQYD